ncbi:MAG: zinc ribbon domain-containing protein [Patescibacteria group bacterium]
MQFWIKFLQPALWGLAVAIILIIGTIIANTPDLLKIKGNIRAFGMSTETEITYADLKNGEGSGSGEFIVDVLTNYPLFSGITMHAEQENGYMSGSMGGRYNLIAGLIITAILFAAVIIITRKSSSVIFILGPLLIGVIILAVVSAKAGFDESDANLGIKMGVDMSGLLFNWLAFYGGVSLVMFLVTKALVRRGLIRGIDEQGPLDFSLLGQAGIVAAGKTMKIAGVIGGKLQKMIGEDNSPATVASPKPADAATKPSAPKFNHRYCILCGGAISNDRCSICQVSSRDLITDPYGLCSRCDAPKSLRAKFCYHCGLLFENDISDSSSGSAKFCSKCGEPQETGDKFCSHCGSSNQ